MNNTRLQLTLFIPFQHAEAIEKIRSRYNPEQYRLIKAHVTLCREDELEPLGRVQYNLSNLLLRPLSIEFGPAQRFSEGKGLMLPAVGDQEAYQQLRCDVLKGIDSEPRRAEPHITLMHPRNSTCTDSVFSEIEAWELPGKITFDKISLIKQETGKEWQVLQEYFLT